MLLSDRSRLNLPDRGWDKRVSETKMPQEGINPTSLPDSQWIRYFKHYFNATLPGYKPLIMLLLSRVKTYISGRYTSLSEAEQRNEDAKFCPQPRGISYQHAVFLYTLIAFLVVILFAFPLTDPSIPYNDTLGTYETGWKTEISVPS